VFQGVVQEKNARYVVLKLDRSSPYQAEAGNPVVVEVVVDVATRKQQRNPTGGREAGSNRKGRSKMQYKPMLNIYSRRKHHSYEKSSQSSKKSS
jgi:hypothetical protein